MFFVFCVGPTTLALAFVLKAAGEVKIKREITASKNYENDKTISGIKEAL